MAFLGDFFALVAVKGEDTYFASPRAWALWKKASF